jgi:squalene-hopene/tetraprenyl-beta-curcumene cyclase
MTHGGLFGLCLIHDKNFIHAWRKKANLWRNRFSLYRVIERLIHLMPHSHAIFAVLFSAMPLFAEHPGKGDEDPYNLLPPPGATRDTAGEEFMKTFSASKAGAYLDLRSHNIESNCYACHSSGAYMAARPLIDPLAAGVMETRVMMQRYAADFTSKPPMDRMKSGPVDRAGQILSAVAMARHDAVSTGKLHPLTRKALDHIWAFQLDDGSIYWVPFKEAPSAIDHHWGITLIALGASVAPDGYAQSEPAKSGIEKLRGWFKKTPLKDLHETGLTLIADGAVGGILRKEQREQQIDAFFAKQQPTHGWSMADMSVHPDWKRPDGLPLDSKHSDSYATAFAVYALARAGVPKTESRLAKAIEWITNSQRQTGGYYTFSPRKKDILASFQATSFAVQALSAVGVLPLPPKVTQEQFDAAYATANKLIPTGVMRPNSTGKQARDAKMAASTEKPAAAPAKTYERTK